jgi:transposase
MSRRLREEEVMTMQVLHERGCSKRAIARTLGVDEKAVRYRLQRLRDGVLDGRRDKPFRAEAVAEAIAHWFSSQGRGINLQMLYEYLEAEHGYAGSYKSIQRYVRRHYPRPRVRTRRRVETPPGAQGQADWGAFGGVRIGGQAVDLLAFHLVLSHSRAEAVVWSETKNQLAWLAVHNRAFERLGGVPAVVRVDNESTAIATGAGPWGQVTVAYQSYADALRFHVDATRPRQPQEKGKVERRIRGHRQGFDPHDHDWTGVEELQRWTDAQVEASMRRRVCPATGTSVFEAWQAERLHLGALPQPLPEPFDLSVQRRVGRDATVRFEGRTYSVPFRFAETAVEVRGCTRVVQVWAECQVVAEHPRHSRERILLDPTHYEGPSTDRVAAPVPLGRMGQRLQEIWTLTPEQRPIDLYAALAEVAR